MARNTGEKTDRDLSAVSTPQGEHHTTLVQPTLVIPSTAASSCQPEAGFALKQTSGKRVFFSLEQKQIIIVFYDRQASTGVTAEPQDVVAKMQRRGVTPLKEST